METPRLNVRNVIFFALSFVVALVTGIHYLVSYGLTRVAVGTFLMMFFLTLMSISAGYHRLFSHRTHDAAGWLQWAYLIFGAASFEQSCMKWATEHRQHHRYVDTDRDPYNIKRGAWWAHIGWILHDDTLTVEIPSDLLQNRAVAWQQRNWIWVGVLAGFGLPTLVGAFFSDAWGGLVFGGFVRMVVAHHCTFMINSLAHMIGSQPYSDASTARDSWITAIFTFGEGYHNFHHWKPGDYRNGPKFYNWDPPKWFIRAMSWIGQTWDLQKSPEEALAKAMVEMQRKRIEAHGVTWSDRLEERFSVFMKEVDELTKRRRAWMEAKRDVSTQVLHVEVKMLRERFEEARKRYREAHREWRYSLRQLNQASPAAV